MRVIIRVLFSVNSILYGGGVQLKFCHSLGIILYVAMFCRQEFILL